MIKKGDISKLVLANKERIDNSLREEKEDLEHVAYIDKKLAEYAGIILENDYENIMQVYEKDKKIMRSDDLLFGIFKMELTQLVTMDNPYLENYIDHGIRAHGMLSKWIYVVGSDMPRDGAEVMINEKGREIVNGWKSYIGNNDSEK